MLLKEHFIICGSQEERVCHPTWGHVGVTPGFGGRGEGTQWSGPSWWFPQEGVDEAERAAKQV